MVEGITGRFAGFIDEYGGLFRTRGRDNSAVARRYLQGLAQAQTCTFEGMAAVVEGACPQQFQHFISNSPWQPEPVVEKLARDVDAVAGGKPDSCLLLDETSFIKQGEQSVGVARQWCGRLGKIDSCQVAVFAVQSDGQHHAPIDMRLYLPKNWIEDPARCDRAGVPATARQLKSKCEHALDMVRAARARGTRFEWVGGDAGYGKDPAFLRALDDANEVFVVDVHRSQRVWIEDPKPHIPEKPGRTGQGKKPKTSTAPVTVEGLARTFGPQDWQRCVLRDGTRGPLRVDVACRRVWVWDGKESAARCWHLIVRREVGSPKTIKYSFSNAPAETPTARLAQMQGQRYWIERSFEDAKGQCGLADYQALGWLAWHHHVTMVMLAMLMIAQARADHQPLLELLTARDVVDILKETLPRKPEGRDALLARINGRHQRRRGAIESRFRSQQKSGP